MKMNFLFNEYSYKPSYRIPPHSRRLKPSLVVTVVSSHRPAVFRYSSQFEHYNLI